MQFLAWTDLTSCLCNFVLHLKLLDIWLHKKNCSILFNGVNFVEEFMLLKVMSFRVFVLSRSYYILVYSLFRNSAFARHLDVVNF